MYLEKSMEAGLLFFTADNRVLAHLEEVDEGWVGPHQLFRLDREDIENTEAYVTSIIQFNTALYKHPLSGLYRQLHHIFLTLETETHKCHRNEVNTICKCL